MTGVEYVPHQAVPQAAPSPPAGPPPTFEGDPPQRPRRLWLRSLTSRLVVGVVALVFVLVAAIGTTTYFALRSFLFSKLDQQLTAASAQNSNYLDRCIERAGQVPPGATLQCFSGPPPPQHEWLMARAGTVKLRPTAFPNVTYLSLSDKQLDAIDRDPERVRTIAVGSQELRITARMMDDGVLVVTGLPTNDVRTTLHRLVLLEVLIGAGALLLASSTTAWGVRRSLRNLYRVTGTAREVAAELSPEGAGLDRRVPVAEEGTEVGQLATSFNTMLGAVETQFAARLDSERRMRQFLADASHELRTPLTSIRGYAELARMQRAVGDASDDNLDRIESEGTRMSRLVEDLLLLARGDADGTDRPVEHELIEVDDLVDDVVSGARASFPGRAIEVEMIGAPHVIGDRDQLLRAVRNLVTNAAVHTQPDRPITVRGSQDRQMVTIQVVDGGPGLPPEEAAHVFERFWRADKARTRARGGSGLGLSIVAAIVRAHGGTVHFASSVESGSTATLQLPAVTAGE